MQKENILEEFYKENNNVLQNKVLKGFLEVKENENLLKEVLTTKSKVSQRKLDKNFKEFIFKIRVISYISNLIYYYTLNYDKRNRLRNSRYNLLLDAPIKENEDNLTTLITIQTSMNHTENEYFKKESRLENWIEDEKLYTILCRLTDKQKSVLELIYLKGLSNKEVAKIYNVSPQNISKLHKRAIQKIRSYYEKDNKDN